MSDISNQAAQAASDAVMSKVAMPESWRFDPCSLWAALSRPSQPTTQPAQAGFFMPGETHDA